jgi:hypothetical protein
VLVSTYDECFSFFKDGIVALAKVEEAYKHEKETKEAIEEMIRSCSLYPLQDTLDAADEGTDENRLLPAMNKIWPFLVVCIRNRNTVVRVHFSSLITLKELSYQVGFNNELDIYIYIYIFFFFLLLFK